MRACVEATESERSVLDIDSARAVWRRFAAYPDYRLYVAEIEGAIVGSYALLVMDNLGHRGAPSAVVEDVVVEPAQQGKGVGRAMMCHALAQARRRSCYKLALSSNVKRDRAHAFYEGLGFTRHGYSFLVELADASP
jgi:GNAT superfamily N-acetyltransferase